MLSSTQDVSILLRRVRLGCDNMHLLLVVWISCCLLVDTAGQCTNTALTSTEFKNFNMTYTGCNDTSVASTTKRSLLDCAVSCLNSKGCVSFSYTKNKNTCIKCDAENVKGLVFGVGSGTSGTVYTLRQGILPTQLLSPTTEFLSLNVPCGLTVGNIVSHDFRTSLCSNLINVCYNFRSTLWFMYL